MADNIALNLDYMLGGPQLVKRDAMNLDAIRYKFRAAMQVAYPNVRVTKQQLKDLVWAYIMGWLGAATSLGSAMDTVEVGLQIRRVNHPAWMPDDSWKWW